MYDTRERYSYVYDCLDPTSSTYICTNERSLQTRNVRDRRYGGRPSQKNVSTYRYYYQNIDQILVYQHDAYRLYIYMYVRRTKPAVYHVRETAVYARYVVGTIPRSI